MTQRWRTVRIFISSTFRDMHAERDYLITVVFPHLRERLEKYKIELIDIDLRWGITEQQANDGRVLELCLQQIDECRPYFVGLLGQRYGWVPDHLPGHVMDHHGWLKQYAGKSITEMEILHGVLENPGMRNHAFFFFREPEALGDIPQHLLQEIYRESNPLLAARLTDLKEIISESGCRVTRYSAKWGPDLYDQSRQAKGKLGDLQNFGKAVEEQIWSAVKSEHTLEESVHISEENQEEDLQSRFIRNRLRIYVGRDTLHQSLLAHIDDDTTRPLILTGASGSGKSSVLARLAEHFSNVPDTLCIAHFVGASPRSTSLRETLARLCRIIDQRYKMNIPIPGESIPLVHTLHSMLSTLPGNGRVLILVDGANQFDEADQPQELAWLPAELGRNAKIILSSIEDPGHTPRVLERARELDFLELPVPPLTNAERSTIIRKVPSIAAKTLDRHQIDVLMANKATTNPLYLLIALEELKGFGSFEGLNDYIAQLPNPNDPRYRNQDIIRAMFNQVIDRLKNDFDRELVRYVLCALACARRGMSERELQAFMAALPGRDDLFPLLRQLRPYLMKKGDLIDFFHRGLWKAVHKAYLEDEREKYTWHLKMAFFFAGKVPFGPNDPRQEPFRFSPPEVLGNTNPSDQVLPITSAADDYIEAVTDQTRDDGIVIPADKITFRILEELPWQLRQSRAWEYLYQLLADLDFMGLLYFHEEQMCKLYWIEIEANSSMRMSRAYQAVIQHPSVFEHRMRFNPLEKTMWKPYQVVTYLLERSSHAPELRAMLEEMIKTSTSDMDSNFCTMALRGLYQRLGLIDEALSLQGVTTENHQSSDRQVQANDLCNRAAALARSGRKEEALQALFQAEEICRDHEFNDLLCMCLLNISHCHIEQDRFEEGMEVLKEMESIARTLGRMDHLASCLGNQGVILRVQGDFEGALAMHEKQRDLCAKWGLKNQIQEGLCQVGLVFEEMENIEEALKYYAEAEQSSRGEESYWLGFSLRRQGIILSRYREDYNKAFEKFEECERIEEQLGDTEALRRVLNDEIEVLQMLGDYERIFEKSEKLEKLDRERP